MAKPMSDGKLDGWRLALTTMDAVVTHAELMTRNPSSSGYMEAMKAAQTVVANRIAREQERRAMDQVVVEVSHEDA
jgi:hypothetical protein